MLFWMLPIRFKYLNVIIKKKIKLFFQKVKNRYKKKNYPKNCIILLSSKKLKKKKKKNSVTHARTHARAHILTHTYGLFLNSICFDSK